MDSENSNSSYSLSFLDRTNIGNARLFKLEFDLGMSGLEYVYSLTMVIESFNRSGLMSSRG